MISRDCIIAIHNIDKEIFIEAKKGAKSIVGHPEIAEQFDLELNRESISLEAGDELYVVTLSKRQNENKAVGDGMKYEFVPEEKEYKYMKVTVF